MIVSKTLASISAQSGDEVFKRLIDSLIGKEDVSCIGIGGELGTKTSELASTLASELTNHNVTSIVLNVSDYFHLPPVRRYQSRKIDINNVGPKEINFNLLKGNIEFIKGKEADILFKPKMNAHTDTIRKEFIEVDRVEVIIVEGLYSLLLKYIDVAIFAQPRANHLLDIHDDVDKRARMIEHEIIRKHKRLAHFLYNPDETLQSTKPTAVLNNSMWV